MIDPAVLRSKAEKCRQLAGIAGDEETKRQLNALAAQYEAQAMTDQESASEPGPAGFIFHRVPDDAR